MAEQAKDQAARNAIGPQDMEKVISACERIDEEIASERGKYMAAAKRLRDKKNDTIDAAVNKGLTKKAIKAKLKQREMDRKRASLVNDLEGDDADDFQKLSDALGDYAETPLGRAAVEAAA